MRIAVFDYQVTKNNPIGGCHRRMLSVLAQEHEFTVFSVAFENPCPEKIRWVRIPVPLRPMALLFVAYHVTAPLVYWLHRLRTGVRFDLVQRVESNLTFGAIVYSHFCHTAFLKKHWAETQASGLRGFLRWLDHRLHAYLEGRVYASAKQILVPSRGLATELIQEFPAAAAKTQVLPNAVDVERLERPVSFDRDGFRAGLGLESSEVVFCFAALGHFERKGLPLLIEALSQIESPRAKLLVVGGTKDLIADYRERVSAMRLQQRVVFAGMQPDVRPYLWAADAFAFASAYETFSLVAFEAAAAALPLITPRLHGVEEIVSDGQTGYVVRRTRDDVTAALRRFLELGAEERAKMGERARQQAMQYNEARFVAQWRCFYNEWSTQGQPPPASHWVDMIRGLL
jgi:glycosyltransferase involved in cell wall biosynthesis